MNDVDKWLRNVNVVRVVALLIGILLWFVVHMDEHANDSTGTIQPQITENTIYDVAVKTTGLDTQSYAITSIVPAQVDITISGTASQLLEVRTKDGQNRIEADLSDVAPGVNQVTLKAVGFPSGVKVKQISPETIEVHVEEIGSKEVPVRIDVTGQPSPGYEASEPIVEPEKVYVTAPLSTLEKIVEVRTAFDLDGAQETVQREVQLEPVNADGEVVKAVLVPSTAQVEVPITIPYKEIPFQIELIGDPAEGYSVASYSQSVQMVTVYGAREVVEALEIYDGVQVDLTGLTNSATLTLDLPLPEGTNSVLPATVEVQIEIVASQSRTLESIPIEVTGLPDDGEIEAVILEPDSGTIDVTVEAAPNIINELKLDDIKAEVDAANLPIGEHEQSIIITLPQFVKLREVSSETATIRVMEASEEAGATPEELSEGDSEETVDDEADASADSEDEINSDNDARIED